MVVAQFVEKVVLIHNTFLSLNFRIQPPRIEEMPIGQNGAFLCYMEILDTQVIIMVSKIQPTNIFSGLCEIIKLNSANGVAST